MYSAMKYLQGEAEISANLRGHVLENDWLLYGNGKRKISWNSCKHCNMQVIVIANPLPNEINISGEAVAIDCNRETKQ